MKIIVLMESSDHFEGAETVKASIEGHMIPERFGTGDVVILVPYER